LHRIRLEVDASPTARSNQLKGGIRARSRGDSRGEWGKIKKPRTLGPGEWKGLKDQKDDVLQRGGKETWETKEKYEQAAVQWVGQFKKRRETGGLGRTKVVA